MINNDSNDPDEVFIKEIREKIKNKTNLPHIKPSVSSIDWKNEADVRVYLNNLETEYTFQCVGEKNPEGCHRLANFYELIRGKYSEATGLYKKNCDDFKFGPSCLTYSKNTSLGRGKNILVFNVINHFLKRLQKLHINIQILYTMKSLK